jgi:hypothetical protein
MVIKGLSDTYLDWLRLNITSFLWITMVVMNTSVMQQTIDREPEVLPPNHGWLRLVRDLLIGSRECVENQ